MKSVLDTNVLISALVFGGKPKKILEKAFRKEFELFTSVDLLAELKSVLMSRKFQYPADTAQAVLDELCVVAEQVKPPFKLFVIKNDPSDNRVLECAVEAKADVIVSGDSDLLSLKKFRGISIDSPDQFLAKLKRKTRLQKLSFQARKTSMKVNQEWARSTLPKKR